MTKAHRAMRPLAVVPVLLLASSVGVLASESAEGAHVSESSEWVPLAFSFFNFSLFLFLLRRYAWPAVKDFLTVRRGEVVEAMAIAERARQEAEEIRREFAAKEAALEETRRRLLEEIRLAAAGDRERSIREASEAAERYRLDAERQADHDLARARRELRAEAARLAAALAERDVSNRLGDGERSRLISEFVEGVSPQ